MEDFETLLPNYERMIYKISKELRIYRDQDEFYHIGLIALWEASTRFDHTKGKFSSYAYNYIRGRMLSKLKEETRFSDAVVLEEELVDYIVQKEESSTLWKDILASGILTENQKKWLVNYCIQGYSIEEISQFYNVSAAAVKSWRKQALKHIKTFLVKID